MSLAIEYPNGDIYEGAVVAQGNGKMTYTNGDVYQGNFENGVRCGSGTYTYSSGDKYEGTWKDNKREGNGIFHFADGGHYNGEYHNNERHGRGELQYSNGDRYKGLWENGERNGLGVMTVESQHEYNGEFKNGHYHGSGTLQNFEDGSSFVGFFQEGKKHGKAVLTLKNAEAVIQGYWIQDILITGTILYKNGAKYNGELRKLKKHGRGKMTYADGSVYIGDWKEDIRKGQGKLHPNNKHLIPMEGIWNDNKCTSTVTCDIVFDFNTSDYDFVLKGRNGKRVSSSQLGSSQKKRAMEKITCVLRENTVEEDGEKEKNTKPLDKKGKFTGAVSSALKNNTTDQFGNTMTI